VLGRAGRWLGWGLVGVAAAAAAMMALSLARVSWTGRSMSGVELISGGLRVRWCAPGVGVSGPTPGLSWGGQVGQYFSFSTSGWVSQEKREWWLGRDQVLRSGPSAPMGAGPPVVVWVSIRLWWLAAISDVPGGVLLLVCRRPMGPGRCPSCGYSLAGLAEGSACPECGRAAR
jgi:hypothetical protein